jgi:hypothetical protein
MSDDVERIRESRNNILDGLEAALARVNAEIPIRTGVRRRRLATRQLELINESDEVMRAATNEVLALSEVKAAASQLVAIGNQMTERSKELQNATAILTQTGKILSLGQRFMDIVDKARG